MLLQLLKFYLHLAACLRLLQVLEAEQEMLLVSSRTDLINMQPSSWPLHYILRPASNGLSMLLRRSVLSIAVSCITSLSRRLRGATDQHFYQHLQNVHGMSWLAACCIVAAADMCNA